MRKLDSENENFIDNILIDISESVSNLFFNLNFTPNMITTLSLITGLLSVYFLFINNIFLFGVFWIISYFFDCLDGYFARKYKMVSEFGEYYDSIKDTVVFIIFLGIYVYKFFNHRFFYICSFILLILLLAVPIHMGCQQIVYNRENDKRELLDNYVDIMEFIGFNKEYCKELINYTKYLGVGTLQVGVILIIIFLHFSEF